MNLQKIKQNGNLETYLNALLNENKQLPNERLKKWVYSLLEGLTSIHESGNDF